MDGLGSLGVEILWQFWLVWVMSLVGCLVRWLVGWVVYLVVGVMDGEEALIVVGFGVEALDGRQVSFQITVLAVIASQHYWAVWDV